MSIEEFVHSGARNAWIKDGDFSIYIRRSHRVDENDSLVQYLDLANIENSKAKLRGKGAFWSLLERAKKLVLADPKLIGILVESIQNKKLVTSLLAHGFTKLPHQGGTVTVILKLK